MSLSYEPAQGCGAAGKGTLKTLRRIMASTAYEISTDKKAVWLRGPDRRYQELDPDLADIAAHLGVSDFSEIGTFHRKMAGYSLCLEDCWTGWFLAEFLDHCPECEPTILVHLDDHADMMPTLLLKDEEGQLRNPATATVFDPSRKSDWETAISTGAVNIGNWLTALVHHPRFSRNGSGLHIRHLRPSPSPKTNGIVHRLEAATLSYKVLPGHDFATVSKHPAYESELTGNSTYLETSDPFLCLDALPKGRLLVHIDLDYFINDFNGNPGNEVIKPDSNEVRFVTTRIDEFQEAMARIGRKVAVCIIATSPGFCSSRHWNWIISELCRRLSFLLLPSEIDMIRSSGKPDDA